MLSAEDLDTLDGTVVSVVFRNEETGFTVLKVEQDNDSSFRLKKREVTVVGTCAVTWEGEALHAVGEWYDDPIRGRQFKAKEITCVTPKSVEGVRRYLASGLIRGIGPVLAGRIVDAFGADTLNVLDNYSGRLREIPKLGPKKIESIRQAWRDAKGTREVMIFTQTYGISVSKTSKIYRRYGADSIAIIKADPYRLCRDIWGIGFQTADKIALSVGMPKNSPLRARAAIYHTLQSVADEMGHCWLPEPELLLLAQEKVGIELEVLAEALKAEAESGRIIIEEERIYLRDLFFNERQVACKLKRLLSSKSSFAAIDAHRAVEWWEREVGFTLAPAQMKAVMMALNSKVSILTGGPGVGKTTIIRALVDIYRARKGSHKIRIMLAAPTGRAAKRMTESTNAPALTVHRLLKYNPQTNKFTFSAENPLEGDVFIFDETSMLDIRLTKDLLDALPDTATVVFVGDTDQLPSVGPGNMLSDLIKSDVIPCTRLTQIFRQDSSGLIVRNAHHVNAGEGFETNNSSDSDFYFIAKNDPNECLRLAIDFMTTRIPKHFGMNALQDVQVLSPMRRNALGAENLNTIIQSKLNADGVALQRGGTMFRTGDRVMQLRNNYDKDVYNGDIGFVRDVNVEKRSLVVMFDDEAVEYESGDLDELTLAYATTIHKSQGSEYPAVIVILHNQHYMMLQRNLLYTAITRGKKLVLVIGSPWAVKKAIETNLVRERRTTLAKYLQDFSNTSEQ